MKDLLSDNERKRQCAFHALADPTRREIIELLASRALTIVQIANHFSISRPAISKHIKILHEAGVIIFKKSGREKICHLHFSSLEEVANWIMKYELFWMRHQPEFRKSSFATPDDEHNTLS